RLDLARERARIDDRRAAVALQRPFTRAQELGREREVELPDRRRVRWDLRAHARRRAQEAAALLLVDHVQTARARARQEDRLAEALGQLFEARARGGDERLALEHAEAQREQRDARLVAPARVLLDQPAARERREQPVRGRLRQLERAAELGHTARRAALLVQV